MNYALAEITSDDLISFVSEGPYEVLLQDIIDLELVNYQIIGIDLTPEEVQADVSALRADLEDRFSL